VREEEEEPEKLLPSSFYFVVVIVSAFVVAVVGIYFNEANPSSFAVEKGLLNYLFFFCFFHHSNGKINEERRNCTMKNGKKKTN
jgi:hypothetical protein